jgi:homoserine O-succinyltransferase
MPLFLDRRGSGSPTKFPAARVITIGLINNMPDPAFEATERQFTDLIDAAANDVVVRLLLLSIPEVPRSPHSRPEVAERYRNVSEVWDNRLDGLIVTGTEPLTKNLKDEPYWDTLSRVVDWAGVNTISTVWSCLAAHAAVLHTDGIERRTLAEKLFGVFNFESAAAHPMMIGATAGLRIPHSRYNDLPERALLACGYHILLRSETAGVDMFVRQDKSLNLYLQGHPEYEASTLLREYRRDVGRFLRKEREEYPALPVGYFDNGAPAIANVFRERAIAERHECLLASFPMSALTVGLGNPWRHHAVAMFSKWIEYLKEQKAERLPRGVPLRRTWRNRVSEPARPRADGSAS